MGSTTPGGAIHIWVASVRSLSKPRWHNEIGGRRKTGTSPAPTRHELETAARVYFAELCREVDRPRNFGSDPSGAERTWQIEESDAKIVAYEEQIADNDFDVRDVGHISTTLEKHLGHAIAENDRVVALQLIARAKRQQLRFFVHQVANPLEEFESDDALFRASEEASIGPTMGSKQALELVRPDITIQRAQKLYMNRLEQRGLGHSRITETVRVLDWLSEEFGSATPIAALDKSQWRSFRDALLTLKRGLQGKSSRLRDRVTDQPEERLHNDTRSRYWRSVKGLTKMLSSEYDIPDIAGDLEFDTGKRMASRETEALSLEEVDALFALPIYRGAKSAKRLHDQGDHVARRSHWWSGILMLIFGMRGGEFSQLMATDFNFDAKTPHFKIQPGVMEDGRKKSHKDHLKVLSLPIPGELLELGLRDFVELHQKRFHKKPRRLFHEMSLGADRAGGGASKFWNRLFTRHGLHKPGRGSHVFRHTVSHHLAAAGLSEQQIGLLIGHKSKTVTGKHYAKGDFLELKLEYLSHLPYLSDLVDKLGGPYDPKKHQ